MHEGRVVMWGAHHLYDAVAGRQGRDILPMFLVGVT